MSQSCPIEKCTRKSRGLCDCCEKNLCLQHLNEHNTLLLSKLNPLVDEVNELEDRLKTLNMETLICASREKLERWRKDCYEKIDSFFEKKSQMLNEIIQQEVDQQRQELNQIHIKINELMNAQETTRQEIDLFTSTIRQLKTNMEYIEKTYCKIDTRPLLIEDTFVLIKKMAKHELDLSTLSPAYKTINRPEKSFISLAANDQHLLIHQDPNLCFYDLEMNLVKQTLWSHGEFWEMCWSKAIQKFIILGVNSIFLLDEDTMSIDNVYTIEGRTWLSCTCSDRVFYASTHESGASIMEFTLSPSIEFIKEWKHPITCTKDEIIYDMAHKNENLAVLVGNRSDQSLRIELRYVETLDCIWTLDLRIKRVQNLVFRFSPLTCNEWLVVDYQNGKLIQISRDGKLKISIQYHTVPRRAILFDMNKLLVSAENTVYVHTIA
ncbi:unnamed protein product [Rotaria socialis]|uniref:Uncharacterized protein n=1 Tax=Rotaria socialis TaxID=392032 RepID=A0A820QMZ3_9BILA|nr:unnamed protein product [Rotaria socialis]CAF3442091.1 unnamed protein product [Rotaria socialis]CAF3485915.1 unnamed protein product [Rotaria socialis]CAF4422747.1 unnamed protein product [Rotaria socialis]CAF4675793.1 unnamed protein product [Rotaria socialis]